jgi:hypothetical protein
MLARAKCV